MFICKLIRKCQIATFERIDNVLISAGVHYREDGARFVALCVQDLVGCQHIRTQVPGALRLIERGARALGQAGRP